MKKLLSTKYSNGAFNTALFLLRVVGGSALAIAHGYDKLMNFSKYAGKFADPFHIGTTASLALTVFAEFFCAIFVVLGLFTRLACIPIVIAMAVAFFYAHKGHLFTDGEMAGLFLVIFSVILLVGPGKASADNLIGK